MRNNRSFPELVQELAGAQTEKVKLAIADVDGILRGKVIGFEKFRSVAEKGLGFCDVVFGWDAEDRAYDNGAFTGWHTGYPDVPVMLDAATFRRVPWEGGIPFFLGGLKDAEVCPRGLLRRVTGQATEAGFAAVFAQEFEWFNFMAPAGGGVGLTGGGGSFADLRPMTRGMFGYSILRASQGSDYFHALFDGLKNFSVPLEGLHTETGPGVYEAAILYADVLEAADRAVLFKTAVKEIAHRHGILPTFMAKVSEQLPGCSGHVHQSLWTADGTKNLFYEDAWAAEGGRVPGMSKLMESYMAGQLYCLPHILPMMAPTVNSYKRLVEGAWAPTTLTWAVDNRTVALRAMPGGEASTRLETRVVGSDANPYLAMAACLAAGLYGVRKGLELATPETKGNGYADKRNGVLPRNLWEATQAMKASPLARELFGEAFTDHFVRTREWEWREFGRVVTDWELKRYLEII